MAFDARGADDLGRTLRATVPVEVVSARPSAYNYWPIVLAEGSGRAVTSFLPARHDGHGPSCHACVVELRLMVLWRDGTMRSQ